MAFCKNCGTQLDDDAKFCVSCGTPTGSSTIAKPAEPQVQQPQYQQPQFQQPVMQHQVPMYQKTKFEPYNPPEGPLTKEIFMSALKFNFKSVVKIAYTEKFTYIAIQLFLVAAIIQGLVFSVMFSLNNVTNSGTMWSTFNTIFLISLMYFYLFIFIGEYNLMNSNIKINIMAGFRFLGFLSIFFIFQGILAAIYAVYVTFMIGGRGSFDYFFQFQFYTMWILGIILIVYLVKYMSLRLGLNTGVTVLLILISSGITSIIVTPLGMSIATLLNSTGLVSTIANYVVSGLIFLSVVFVEIKSRGASK